MGTVLPPEFFGLSGLGQAAQQGAGLIQQHRQLGDQKAMQSLQLALSILPKDDPQVKALLQQVGPRLLPDMDFAGVNLQVGGEELLDRQRREDLIAVQTGTATPEQIQRVNQWQYGTPGGIGALSRKESLGEKTAEEALAGAAITRQATEQQLKERKALNVALDNLRTNPKFAKTFEGVPQGEGMTMGFLTLSELTQNLDKGSAELALIKAQTRQADALAARYIREAEEAGQNAVPGTEEWFKRYAAVSLLPPHKVAQGFYAYDRQNPEDKAAFDADYGRFIELSMAEMQARIREAQAEESPAVARLVEQYQTEVAARASGKPGTMDDNEFLALKASLYNAVMPGSAVFTKGTPKNRRSLFRIDGPLPQTEVFSQALDNIFSGVTGTASPSEGQTGGQYSPEAIPVLAQQLLSQGHTRLNAEQRQVLGVSANAIQAEIDRLTGGTSTEPPVGASRSPEGEQAAKDEQSQLAAVYDSISTKLEVEESDRESFRRAIANLTPQQLSAVDLALSNPTDAAPGLTHRTRVPHGQPAILGNQRAPGVNPPISQTGPAAASPTLPPMFTPQPFSLPKDATGMVTPDSIMTEIRRLEALFRKTPRSTALRDRIAVLRSELDKVRQVP